MSGAYQSWLLKCGAEIYARREELGLKQRQLGAKSGVSTNTVANIERGLVPPNTQTVWAVREVLGLPNNGDVCGVSPFSPTRP